MTQKQKHDLLRAGLIQIPKRDLKRLARHLAAGKPVLLTGEIIRNGVG